MKRRLAVAAACVALLGSCGGRDGAPFQRSVAAPAAAAPQPASATAALEAASAARKLIRTGQIALEVPRFADASRALALIAEQHGGYLAESRSSRSGPDRVAGSVTIRVPAERFGAVCEAVKGLGTLESESIATQDVTKAYADLETRLRVKRGTEARIRKLLEDRAAALADVLAAERELARIVEEIEALEGERRYYDQLVGFSTLTVELREPGAGIPSGILGPLRRGLRDFLRVLAGSAGVAVYLTAFLLPWVVLFALAWTLLRALRRRRSPPAS